MLVRVKTEKLNVLFTDIMTSIWSGFNTGYDPLHKSTTIDHLKENLFAGRIRQVQFLPGIYDNWEPDLNVLESVQVAYHLPRAKLLQFYTHSPVPSILTIQWAEKSGSTQPEKQMEEVVFLRAQQARRGVQIKQGTDIDKLTISASTDATRYLPAVTQNMGPSGSRAVFPWVSPEAFQSTQLHPSDATQPQSYLISKTITVSERDVDKLALATNYIYIESSNATHHLPGVAQIRVSSLRWPDPPEPRSENSGSSTKVEAGAPTRPIASQLSTLTLTPTPGTNPVLKTDHVDSSATVAPVEPTAAPPAV